MGRGGAGVSQYCPGAAGGLPALARLQKGPENASRPKHGPLSYGKEWHTWSFASVTLTLQVTWRRRALVFPPEAVGADTER